MMNEEDCLGARFEILLDGETQHRRDTLVTAMGAANIIQGAIPGSRVAVRDLQTGLLTEVPKRRRSRNDGRAVRDFHRRRPAYVSRRFFGPRQATRCSPSRSA